MSQRETRGILRPVIIGVAVLAVAFAIVWLVVRGTGATDPASSLVGPTSPPATVDPSPSGEVVPEPSETTSPPSEPTEAPDIAASTYDSACGLSGGSTELLQAAPEGVVWQNVDGWYFPVSETAGPGVDSRSCFARTPAGSVLAVYTISMLVDGLADDFVTVVTEQTIPGVGQTARLATGAQERPTTVVVPKGFVLDRYTNDEATVSLYLSTQEIDVTCSFTVQWSENDWKLRLQTNGQTPGGCIQSAPSRFIPWGP